MNRSKGPRQYGFTTTETDPFITRVAAEAKPVTHFVIAAARTPSENKLHLLIKKDALPKKSAGFKLFDIPVSKSWGVPIAGTPFRAVTVPVKNTRKAMNQAKDVIQRIKNHNLGRTVRVSVEAI